MTGFICLLIFYFGLISSFGQDLQKCKAVLLNDTLTIENEIIYQKFLWNNGNLIRLSFGDKKSQHSRITADIEPAFSIGGKTEASSKGSFKVNAVENSVVSPAHLKLEVYCQIDQLHVLRIFRLYPRCAAIPCELFLKGKMKNNLSTKADLADLKNIEDDAAKYQDDLLTVTDRILIQDNHWKAKSVEFFDVTDHNNTLLQTYERLLYTQGSKLRGNLLFLENHQTGNRLFFLKEAPTSSVQLYYPGYDFDVKLGAVKVTGLGVAAPDLNDSTWTKAYGSVLGLSLSNDELGILTSLREYQHSIRTHLPGRDDMILMNTWGDRGQDTRVNEAFSMAELEAGAKLGVTHFQLDDGWQTGRSSNSAYKGGSLENIWRNANYWRPNQERFPNGLSPIVKKGKELGIEVCLWFNPSSDSNNIHWENDAKALISLYNDYGIRTFKIDGVKLPTKTSEVNFRRMLDKVMTATNGNVVFNLDVTAGRRGGYHYFNEYGNIFLENRYTDWGNYYPYRTLRNLWMLSKYMPAQTLQIEFLNIWRNQGKYLNDPFGPINYSFDYVFATTMMAQPLAWFEATGLPKEAFLAAPVIQKYKSLQTEIHKGIILPIGEEPDGIAWTGFQSILEDKGYFLIFREAGNNAKYPVKVWLKPGSSVKCEPIIGQGKAFTSKVNSKGELDFELLNKNSYTLYKYVILK